MLYYIISILYDIILYYIMLLYIITCDAAEPGSNTQESNSLSPLTSEYAAFALQPSDSRAPLDHLLCDQLAQPDREASRRKLRTSVDSPKTARRGCEGPPSEVSPSTLAPTTRASRNRIVRMLPDPSNRPAHSTTLASAPRFPRSRQRFYSTGSRGRDSRTIQ